LNFAQVCEVVRSGRRGTNDRSKERMRKPVIQNEKMMPVSIDKRGKSETQNGNKE
jgi:hypothetical protein